MLSTPTPFFSQASGLGPLGLSWVTCPRPATQESLCWVPEQAVFLCENRIGAGLTRVAEVQVVTIRTAETQLYVSRTAIGRKVYPVSVLQINHLKLCELGVAPHTSP